jgi:glycine/D-amino acid oxidase-like deaminating enzyme
MDTPGAFIAGALSGFGSMAACATGALCAAWVFEQPVADYAHSLTPARYQDEALRAELAGLGSGSL